METVIIYFWIFAVGTAIGSFLNVLIYRIPRKLDFKRGRSFCPGCKKQIKFYDNIPVLSWLILGGKCRFCKVRISWRYPFVELLNGALYLFFWFYLQYSFNFLAVAFLSSILIAIFFIDLDYQIIPDILSLPGIVVGLALSLAPDGIGIVSSVIGLLIGGGVLYMIAVLGDWLFKKESMGGGDIKMCAMLGAFLGWQKVVLIFFAGSFIGLIVSLIIMIFSKRLRATRMIPFGPFLALAAMVAIIYGDRLIAFYIDGFWPV